MEKPADPLPRAICHNCGVTMKKPVSGKPRWCLARPCQAARLRHRYETDPNWRAYRKASSQRQKERGYFKEYSARRRQEREWSTLTIAELARRAAKPTD